MTYNPFRDAKFLTLLLDAVIALTTFFVGKYAGYALEDVLTVVGVIQPIFVALFVGFFQRDQAIAEDKGRGALPFLNRK